MKPRLKTSPAARELIKRFEPFRAEAVRDDEGRWVVGYGHRAAAKAGVRVSEDEASLLLIYDVMRAEEVVDDSITGPLSRGQRDALTSFVHDVGVDRFRGSDVARFLFEGRARAAGEALAAFGDGTSARREAESTLFLDALMPAQAGRARKSEPVELVIKIEHPSEERVLEGAISGDVPPPPDAYSDLPPPPPPPDAGQRRRREAEDEIARILAAVQALPPEVRQELGDAEMAPVAEAVSDMRDDPIEADYQAIETEAEIEAEAEVEPAQAIEAEPAAGLAASEAVETPDPDAAADRVIARMAGEIGDEVPESATASEPTVEATADASAEAATPTPTVQAPIGAFDLPEGMGLGFVLTNRQPLAAPDEAEAVDATAQPPAMSAAEATETAPIETSALPERFAMELPAGTELGYALTSVMQGHFRPATDDAPASTPEAAKAPVDVPADEMTEAPEEAGDAAEAAVPADLEMPDAVLPQADEAEIVERTVSLSGDDTPPPHPAETPAEAHGAIGEVAGEPVAEADESITQADDREANDPMMDGHDPLTDAEDDFSPRDLAADVHTHEERPGPRTDDGMWTFLAVLIAGGLLAGFGTVLAAAEWDYIMAQREMTLNFGMALAGFFLVIVAGWQLASIWLTKLKQKAGN